MTKLVHSVSMLVAAGVLSTLAGCELYFHDNHDSDQWNYCGSDGQYQCNGDNCEWVSPTCDGSSGSGGTSGGSNGSNGPGYECGTNNDCAAGCYCTADGVCEEGGFCATDADCGKGYHCDEQRSSCEPNPAGSCTADSDCDTANGQFCDTTSGQCSMGSCAVDTTITCNTAPPVCPAGSAPLEYNGCYTGGCNPIAQCTQAPSCNFLNDATDCLARSADCSPTYTGLSCTHTDGSACQEGADPDCHCAQYVFATCVNKAN